MRIDRRTLLGTATAAGLTWPLRALAQGASGDALAAQIDAWARTQVQPGGAGFALGVWQAGRIVLTRAYGMADMESARPITVPTPFHVASVSKQFAAMAIGLLWSEGKVDLAADIRTYLPWMPDFGTPVRVEHLLHHVSGLRDQWTLAIAEGLDIRDLLSQDRMKNLLRNQRALNFPPGSDYLYCNSGFTLLGEIVAAVSGQGLPAFAKARLFDPIGMTNSHFIRYAGEVIPNRAQSYAKGYQGRPGWEKVPLNYETWGATSLSTTVEDLLKWEVELLHPKILPSALVDRTTQPFTLTDGRVLHYGFGVMVSDIDGRPAIYHGGSDAGFRTWTGRFPQHDAAIVVLRNDSGNSTEAAARLVDIYLPAPAAHPKPPKPLPATDPRAASIVGTWFVEGSELLTIAQGPSGLLSQPPGGPSQPFIVYDDDTADGGKYRGTFYRIHRDPAGKAVALEPTDPSPIVPARDLYAKVAIASPTAQELADIAGQYRSAELDTTYRFAVANGVLTSTTIRVGEPLKWTPSIRDRFDTIAPHRGMTMQVVRDNGHAIALLLGLGRSRNLRFDRVSEIA